MDVHTLKRKRTDAAAKARSLLDEVEERDGDMTAEEEQTFDEIMAQVDDLDEKISREERLREVERNREGREEPPPEEGGGDLDGQLRDLANGKRDQVVVNFSQRDLTSGVDTAGGHTVPETFVARLYEHMTETAAIRQTNVTVVTTSSGEKMHFPKLTAHGSAAIVPEGSVIPESDPTFGTVELDAFKYGQLIQLSSELIADTNVNLLDFIARDVGRAVGEASGADYMNGSGTSAPNGLIGASTVGVTTASGSAITADELIDLFYSVISPYRRNAFWVMDDSTAGHIRKLKDADGQYLWEPSLRTGTPDRIMGRPVVTDPNMPEIALSAKTVLFGDFSAYYIRDVGQLRFERSDHFAFDSDMVTFRGLVRTDGDLVDTTGAVKALQMASA